jgi:hypothetical protein
VNLHRTPAYTLGKRMARVGQSLLPGPGMYE